MYRLFEAIEKIEACEPEAVNRVLTVLDEVHMGEKALVSDGKLVWESEAQGFFSANRDAAVSITESGVTEIAGERIFCDTLGKEKQIVICGGGHVSMPVIQIGIMMGCEVTVLEDRPTFADNARRAGATRVICEPFEAGLDQVEGSADTYFVIVTRGHRYDQVCLEKTLQKEYAYVGMIGSRRRVALVKQQLMERGISREVLDAVYTPIGLDIGAESPAEIAVAIMAEIIEVKNKKKRTYGYSKEIVRAITDPEGEPGRKVLVTIVARKGSAPQGMGAKMLVLSDGRCIGTIGGGCMEAAVIRKALYMIRTDTQSAEVCHVDLTGADAEDEGMVCGGTVEVLLEEIG
ncbi:MAG: XdhC family protein [bacterium]|nr:XdhC family protein [bacterium]MDY4099543.1 XdhC/CoxI family protein [Lachnospiraceae bacterium]